MTIADFDPQDIAALRKMQQSNEKAGTNEPRLCRAKRNLSRPTVQLNVRVQPEIKAKAQKLSDRGSTTLADVIERAVEEIFAREGAT